MDLDDAGTYSFWAEHEVRLSDTDLQGHVNNVAHAAYVEFGRVRFVHALLERSGVPPGYSLVVARIELDYRGELHYPSRLRIGGRALSIGRTSFRVGIGVFADDRRITRSISTLVLLDADGRPTPLTASMTGLLTASAEGQCEFGSRDWVLELSAVLQRELSGRDTAGLSFCGCQEFLDPPRHLREPGRATAAWWWRIRGGVVDVGHGVPDDVDHHVTIDYQLAAMVARIGDGDGRNGAARDRVASRLASARSEGSLVVAGQVPDHPALHGLSSRIKHALAPMTA